MLESLVPKLMEIKGWNATKLMLETELSWGVVFPISKGATPKSTYVMDKFFIGVAVGLCALAWGIPEPVATTIGLFSAIVAIAMASYSLGETVRDMKRNK